MDEIGELLQRQLTNQIGRRVVVAQTDGTEITGTLVEVGAKYVTIKRASSLKTIFINRIEGWEILDEGTLSSSPPESLEHSTSSNGLTVKITQTEIMPYNGYTEPPEATIGAPFPPLIHPEYTPSQQTDLEQTNRQKADSDIAISTPTNNASATSPIVNSRQAIQMQMTLDPAVQAKLTLIEAFQTGKIQSAKIDILSPDFKLSAEEFKKREHQQIWNNLQQKYKYAASIKELGRHYGRIQPIIQGLKSLITLSPHSAGLKRHLVL